MESDTGMEVEVPHLETRVQDNGGGQPGHDEATGSEERRTSSPVVPSLEDAYEATRRRIMEELQWARDRAQEQDAPSTSMDDDNQLPRMVQDPVPEARARRQDPVQEPDVQRQDPVREPDTQRPPVWDHEGIPVVVPQLRRPAAQLHRDLALRGQRGGQQGQVGEGHRHQQPQFRVPGPRNPARHHHPHHRQQQDAPRGRGQPGSRGRRSRSRSRSSLRRVQRELESVARQRRDVQRELAQTRQELEIIELRRQVLRSERERGVREMLGRGQGVRPLTVTVRPNGHERQILDLASPGLRGRPMQQAEHMMDPGRQARFQRLERRQERERAKLEREEMLRRALRQFPWSRPFGSPLGPAQYLGRARRQAVLDLARTAERIAMHPGLSNAWR